MIKLVIKVRRPLFFAVFILVITTKIDMATKGATSYSLPHRFHLFPCLPGFLRNQTVDPKSTERPKPIICGIAQILYDVSHMRKSSHECLHRNPLLRIHAVHKCRVSDDTACNERLTPKTLYIFF